MKYSVFVFAVLLGFGACSNNSEPRQETLSESLVTEKPEVENILVQPEETLEFAPKSYIQSLQARATGIEATMYASGASFSVFDKSSVFSFTQMIAFTAPKSTTKNQIGHIMFLQDGENILLANVYDNGTDVFMESKDEESGKTYYNILLDKARGMFVDLQVQPKK